MTTTTTELPLPAHFDPANAARWDYRPDLLALIGRAAEWRRQHNLAPAGAARFNLHLLLIDLQKDFCFPEGALFVGGRSGRGAIDDNVRTAAFIYRNLGLIKNITTTMDTHFLFQVFFASFWVDAAGRPLQPYREITAADVRSGRVRPNPDVAWWLCGGDYPWLVRQMIYYCEELEKSGKYSLYLWPPHGIIGSAGHALAGVILEARAFHSFARGVQSWAELKGDHALTEHYSVLRPEVVTRFDGQPMVQPNAQFLHTLLAADAVVIAGQAASHCVKNTIDDLLGEMLAVDRALARKVYILADCTSPVAIPDGKGGFLADFTPQAAAALQRFADHGMHVVRSTDPIASWPGMAL